MQYKFHTNYNFSDKTILITGGAGFIGSNLAEYFVLKGAKKVKVLDNLSTGYLSNIEHLKQYPNFEFIEGDIVDLSTCVDSCKQVDVVLHQAALGSVPRSINDPITSNLTNVSGFLNMLQACVQQKVERFVYASSSSVYGDDKTMPKVEEITGNLLSPYAVTKKTNELYANVFYKTYGLQTIGLRYFNVFGPKQNIKGPYAAVIPIFITSLLNKQSPTIFGDGTTTRDFTFIENVIQANVLAAITSSEQAFGTVFNIAYGGTTALNKLYELIAKELNSFIKVTYASERKGDIKNSFANIDKAKKILELDPKVEIEEGLKLTVAWYKNN